MNSLQSKVAQFNRERNLIVDSNLRILDLSSEIGEVCKLGFSEGLGEKVELEKWQEELGDALYSLLSLMNDLDIDAEKSLDVVLKKYIGRIDSRNSMDSGS